MFLGPVQCHNIDVQLVHIPGHHNLLADALSRNLLLHFFLLYPTGLLTIHSNSSRASRYLGLILKCLAHKDLTRSTFSAYVLDLKQFKVMQV